MVQGEDTTIIRFSDFYMFSDLRKLNYTSFIVYTDKFTIINYFKELCRGRLKEVSASEVLELKGLAERMGLKNTKVDLKKLQEFDFDRLVLGDKTLNTGKSEGTWAYKELLGTRLKKLSRQFLGSEATKLLRYFNKRDKSYKGTMLYITDSQDLFITLADKINTELNQRTVIIDGRFASDEFIFDEISRRVRPFQFMKGQRKKISEALSTRLDLLKDLCDDLGVVPLSALTKIEPETSFDIVKYTIPNTELDPILDELYLGNYYNFLDAAILKDIAKPEFKPASQDFKTFSRFQKAHGADKMASDLLYRIDLFIEIKLLLIQGHISYYVKTQNYKILKTEEAKSSSKLARINYKRRIYYIDSSEKVSLAYLINLKNQIIQDRDKFRYSAMYVSKLERMFLNNYTQ